MASKHPGQGGPVVGIKEIFELTIQNSIAFGSAPRREADSQPISQLVRQAVSQTVSRASRQADRNTQFGFFQWQTQLQAAGSASTIRTSNGRMAMQPTADMQVGDSIPGRPTAGRAGRPVSFAKSDPRSNASQTFDPPPPAKCDIQFQGIEASESKNTFYWAN